MDKRAAVENYPARAQHFCAEMPAQGGEALTFPL